ncbi:MAG TPA: HAMP domain-containing sensor histidine kinase, partial [Actinomycetota bacterium]|nr:HAMP domain-containing sensor histidine kinase [Actinomycetota bacterium]
YLSRKIADPLRELAAAASDIAAGGFDRRVPVTSDDEIGVVAESFNQMAQDLGDADRRQREFFLSVSHELRTPLTAIQGYAEALEDGTAEGDKAREAAGVIAGESRRLNRLVSDVLDLARIDARRFQTALEDVDLGMTFLSVKNAFQNKAADASVVIAVADSDLRVRADPDRLTQVLSNLVENALRYSPAGSTIAIDTSVSEGTCRIEVSDSGIGLQPEDLSRAFERQYLWSKYRGLRDVGTGLGLAITKELVEGMGGSVEASNRPQGGAAFAVMLPVA